MRLGMARQRLFMVGAPSTLLRKEISIIVKNARVTEPYVQTTMDSQAPSQYTSDGPTSSASSRHHTGTGHPLHLHQYNTHNHNLPLSFSSPASAYSTSSPTSAFHQQQQPGPGQWGHSGATTHRSGATTRDEVLLPPHPPQHQPQQSQQGTKSGKRDSTGVMSQQPNSTKVESSTNEHGHHHASDDPMPSTSDFVKKLYKCVSHPFYHFFGEALNWEGLCRMLEDPTFQEVVSWGPAGDCFVVKVCTTCSIV
jgi:osomolarity two-component system response regulator SKN7